MTTVVGLDTGPKKQGLEDLTYTENPGPAIALVVVRG